MTLTEIPFLGFLIFAVCLVLLAFTIRQLTRTKRWTFRNKAGMKFEVEEDAAGVRFKPDLSDRDTLNLTTQLGNLDTWGEEAQEHVGKRRRVRISPAKLIAFFAVMMLLGWLYAIQVDPNAGATEEPELDYEIVTIDGVRYKKYYGRGRFRYEKLDD